MNRIRTVAIAVLVLAAGLYIAVKAYVYFGVRGELDRLAALAQPFVQLTYGGISSDLAAGRAAVTGIEVRVPGQTLPVRLASLVLEGKGPGFLLDLAGGFGPDRFPAYLRIAAERLELPEPGELLATLAVPPGDTPCSLTGMLRRVSPAPGEHWPLRLDLSLEYQLDLRAGLGRVQFGYQGPAGDALTVETSLSGLAGPAALLRGVAPRLDSMRFTLRPDRQRVRALVNRCASAEGLTPGPFVDALLGRPPAELGEELGFLPGPGLRRALYLALVEGQEIGVELGPVDDWLQLQLEAPLLAPEQLLERLGLQLRVGGEEIADLSFREPPAPGQEPGQPAQVPASSAATPQRPRRVTRFLDTPLAELHRYLGREARVYSRNREPPYEGLLDQVDDSRLSVLQRLGGGGMTIHVQRQDVLRVEVLRWVRNPDG
jgi:hypothetical protein